MTDMVLAISGAARSEDQAVAPEHVRLHAFLRSFNFVQTMFVPSVY